MSDSSKALNAVGLRLREIVELRSVMDEGNCPCGHTADLVERRIVEVDAEIHDLRTLKANLVQLKQDNEACRTPLRYLARRDYPLSTSVGTPPA